MARSSPNEARARFAKRLKSIRVPKGFRTARAFAEALGIDENRYTRYERGEVEPSLELIMRICELLGATPNDLMCDYIGAAAGGSTMMRGFADAPDGAPPPACNENTSQNGVNLYKPEAHVGVDKSARLDALAWLLASELATLEFSSGTGEAIKPPYQKLQVTSEIFAQLKAEPFAVLSKIAGTLAHRDTSVETQARVLELVDRYAVALGGVE